MSKSHIAMVASPLNGHITPMIQLGRLLAYKGFKVTFLVVKETMEEEEKEKEGQVEEAEEMKIVWVWLHLNPREHGKLGMKAVFDGLEKLGPAILAALSRIEPSPCSIISDYYLTATREVARSLSIPRYAFCSHAVACYSMYRFFSSHGVAVGKEISNMPGLPTISTSELTWTAFNGEDINYFRNLVQVRLRKNWEEEDEGGFGIMKGMICNSVYELEKPAMDALMERGVPLMNVGPLCLSMEKKEELGGKGAAIWSPWPEEAHSLEWLNGQETGSVIYVSFGSTTMLSKEQIHEIALGLEASGKPFLWVLRPNLTMEETPPTSTSAAAASSLLLPEGFQERLQGRCCIVSWAPQAAALAHPSLGAFLTHCGWNSAIESIGMGVPMLAWSYFADQALNRLYIAHVWKLGLAFDGHLGARFVLRGEIETMVRRLMDTEEGSIIRERCKVWKGIVASAIAPGGSSHTDFLKLQQELHSLSSPSL